MVKSDIENDVLTAYLITKYSAVSDKVFYSTNENVRDLVKYFDFSGKSILTVMGSGDQVFHLMSANASKIDTYDKNILTKYYYYLRIWTMRYLNLFYPPEGFDRDFVNELLELVEPINEQEEYAYQFWIKYLKKIDSHNIDSIFMRYTCTAFKNEIKDIKGLCDRLPHMNVDFFHENIVGDIDIPRKYDFIYTSNIRDWIWQGPRDTIVKYRDNLFNLLNDNGIVICSNLDCCPLGVDEERCIFEENFSYHSISGRINDPQYEYRWSPGYYYKKK